MQIDITYPEMAYMRELLRKNYNHRETINEEIRMKILEKIQKLENDYGAGFTS